MHLVNSALSATQSARSIVTSAVSSEVEMKCYFKRRTNEWNKLIRMIFDNIKQLKTYTHINKCTYCGNPVHDVSYYLREFYLQKKT